MSPSAGQLLERLFRDAVDQVVEGSQAPLERAVDLALDIARQGLEFAGGVLASDFLEVLPEEIGLRELLEGLAAQGLPLTEPVAAANVHDTHELFPLINSVPAVRMPSGQRRPRPTKLHADKAYASRKNRQGLRMRGIVARIARPSVGAKERLGRYRWAVERTLAWKNQLRRLRFRDERRDDVHFGFLVPGCCVMHLRRLCPGIC